MSNQPAPRIDTTNVSVDHSTTVVYKQAPKKTNVPPWAQAQLKPAKGGNTRTFKGGTTVTTTKAGPVITPGGPSPSPNKPSDAPQITVTTAAGGTAPKRVAQPHEKLQVAAAPVAYVPDQRLYKPKKDDKSYLNKQEDSDVAAPVSKPAPPPAQAPAPPPVAPPAAAPAPPAPAVSPPAPVVSPLPATATGAGGGGTAAGGGGAATSAAAGGGTATAAAPAAAATTSTTVTTTTVEQGGCCSIL